MAGLKEVRNRIASVGSTRQITQAMKLVSAAKLRRAQDAITQMRPYAEKLQEILVNVSASLDASENPYAVERETKRVLLVAVTSPTTALQASSPSPLLLKVPSLRLA